MERAFSGWREGRRHYLPWFIIAALTTGALWPLGYAWLGIPVLLFACGTLLFFRDFPRTVTGISGEVIAPADGTVVAIEEIEETPHYDGRCLRISIFMSVFNVHVNRAPCDCTVRDIRYAPGAYKNAIKEEASRVNESNAVWLDTQWGKVTVRQISGAIARHIVCPVKLGTALKQGEKFGMIKFGSRVEVYLPTDTEALVELKQKTCAGITRLAKF
ncbi:MAG: phosphatidylserine decarboxylase family protein [Candidatus Hydrogenedentes bacterium]|nr:phosphatidylserine decarboxylase family protein [Candidatus Hydrogenedentota bacterium]